MSYRVTQKCFISFFIKAWILIFSYQLLKGSLTSLVLANCNEQKLKENDKFTNDGFVETIYEEGTSDVESNGHSCKYYKLSKRLMCSGSIDYSYLKTIRNKEINEFVVGNYLAGSSYKRKYWSPDEIKTGEWYLKLPAVYQLLTGKVQLKDLGLQIDVNMRLLPKRDSKGFRVEGEAFSNKVIKISWKLKGNLSLDFLKNKTVISLDVGAIGGSDWRLQNNITFSSRNVENESDLWRVNGIIKSDFFLEDQIVFYKGTVLTKIEKEECNFGGEVKTKNGNLEAIVSGSVSKKLQKKQITIPKSAFSNMTIKSILFKDSNFYNDFDNNSFEGLRGLKRISFTDSKLEIFPRLDNLFHYFSDLEEIYIEDCTVPQLKFGVTSTLEKVRRFSLKGSGPLHFDDTSFLWLKNSPLEFLNLQHSHIKISLKTTAVLWSVNKTLKHLDISHSTLNEEGKLNLILKNLSIVTLKAEGLNLNKIPTSALANVRKTLTYLSLRENDFRKNFEKNMFNTILNFPLMVNLKELNLEECHINYIEKGTFDNLPNLKTLHLGYNQFENIQDGWMYVTPKVRHLSFNHKDFIPQPMIGLYDTGTTMNLSRFRNLEILDLSDGIFREINKIVSSLGNSLRNLSLRNTRLYDLPDNFFDNLSALEVLDLSYNRNLKGEEPFSFDLFKNLKKLKLLDLKHCKITVATAYQAKLVESLDSDDFALENLEYLDLSGNNFKILDSKILKAFPNIKILNLSGNSITEWRSTMLSNEHLETVFLDENKIETITEEMLSDIRRLKQVKLGRNPFVCGSYVYQIIKMIEVAKNQYELNDKNIISETEVQEIDLTENFFEKIKNNQVSSDGNVKFLDWFENNYICYSWSQAKFVLFTQVNEDFRELSQGKKDGVELTFLWWTGIVVLGVVIAIAIICWKFLDSHLITRAVRNAVALSFIGRNEKGITNFKYNVFVSYSAKDRSWVIENLLPRLESGHEEQSVCLHERDFQVGLSIIENILNSIESSRNIILVVSQAFLKSQWCQYEMQLAQFRLLEKGRHQLILIFLENIPAIKRPKTLRYLMMTKTYLEWPLNPTNHRAVDTFWNRLMRSLEDTN